MFENLWGWLKDVHLLALCNTENLQVSIKSSGLKLILSISNLPLLKFCLETVGTHFFLPFKKKKNDEAS